jgi:hypothetical protein
MFGATTRTDARGRLPRHGTRAPIGAALFASPSVGTVFALLFALHGVAQQSVAHGAAWRKTAALRNEAVWRCNAWHAMAPREDCLTRARALPAEDSMPKDEDVAVVTTPAALGRRLPRGAPAGRTPTGITLVGLAIASGSRASIAPSPGDRFAVAIPGAWSRPRTAWRRAPNRWHARWIATATANSPTEGPA